MRRDGRIRSERDLHSRFERVAKHVAARRDGRASLRCDRRGKFVDFPRDPVSSQQRRNEIGTFLFHHRERLGLHERSMFDRIDAGLNRHARGGVAVTVRRDLASPVMRFLHDRVHFVLRELRRIDRIGE